MLNSLKRAYRNLAKKECHNISLTRFPPGIVFVIEKKLIEFNIKLTEANEMGANAAYSNSGVML